jgi:hypothetical protein
MVSKSEAAKAAEVNAPEINWADINDLAAARAALGTVVSSSDALGDGSEFIKDKNTLKGVPFLVLDWRFVTDEETQREYVNVLIMGANGNKARFNDGSTGVYAQLKGLTEQYGGTVGLEVKSGLRRSDYKNPDGTPATTYYLST